MSTQTMSEQIALLKNIIVNLRGQVEEADAALERICTALTEESGIVKQETDFARLRYEGGKHPYTGHPAARSSMPDLYYLLLLTVLTSAEATEAQWMHLYRVAAGAGYEQDVRDLLPAAHAITDAKIIECVESLHRDNLVNAFLLDAMLLALLHEESPTMLEYIAGLFALIGAPREAVNETIQAAKHIAAQDREAYWERMIEAEQIDIKESGCYLFQLDGITMVNDIVQAQSIEAENVTLVCAKVKNMYLNLDSWKTKNITFHYCIFENSGIGSTQKEATFVECYFYEKDANTSKTALSLAKTSSFTRSTFKNLTMTSDAKTSIQLFLSNATIEHCTFMDCYLNNAILLYLSEGTVTNSTFIRCQSEKCDELIDCKETKVMRCNFSECKINVLGFAMIIRGYDHSLIEDCRFEQCSVNRALSSCGLINLSSNSTASNNTFHECSCEREIF